MCVCVHRAHADDALEMLRSLLPNGRQLLAVATPVTNAQPHLHRSMPHSHAEQTTGPKPLLVVRTGCFRVESVGISLRHRLLGW